jgi:hypothetical protein
VKAVLHIHYNGPFTTNDEGSIAQVTVRFTSTDLYMFNPAQQVAIVAKKNFAFRPTSENTNAQKKHFTGYMDSKPPPWLWRTDPRREMQDDPDPFPPNHEKKFPPGFKYSDECLQRFRETHDILTWAEKQYHKTSFTKIKVPIELPVGGKALTTLGDDDHPFENPIYWAGWIVTGDGTQ